MLKQPFNRMKNVMTILLAVFLVASLTVGAASACSSSHGHHHVSHNHKHVSHTCGSGSTCKTGHCGSTCN